MPPPGRILDPDLQFPEPFRIALQHTRQPQLLDLFLHPARQTRVHAAAAGQHDGLVEIGADVDVRGLDGVEEEFGDTRLLDVDEVGLEEAFGGFEAFAADADDAAVGQGVGFHEHGGVFAEALVQRQVVGDVAQFLFDLAHGFEVGGAVQGVAPAEEQRDQVARHVPAGDVEAAG